MALATVSGLDCGKPRMSRSAVSSVRTAAGKIVVIVTPVPVSSARAALDRLATPNLLAV